MNGRKGSGAAGWEGSSSLGHASGSQQAAQGRQAPHSSARAHLPSSKHELIAAWMGFWVEIQWFGVVQTSEVFTICDRQPLKGVRGKRKVATCSCCHRLCVAWSVWLGQHIGVYSDCHYSACLHRSRHRGVNSWLGAVQSLPVQVLLPRKLVQIPLHSQMEILIACQARHLQCTVCACAL